MIYTRRWSDWARPDHDIPGRYKHISITGGDERIMVCAQTYCMIVKGMPMSRGTTGAMVVRPIRPSCNAVLYLLMVVGWTSAEGREKSQYRAKVLGGGRDIQR
jgi:hypothetical protein